MNVLFIVMEFIPLNVAGVYRPLKFINGLKNSGINPIVISFEIDENIKKIHKKTDYKLNELLNPGITVVRIPLSDITNYYSNRWRRFLNIYFNSSDNFLKAWKKNFYNQIPGLIEQYCPEAIITTCHP